jgi:hypothetical protein
MPRFTIKDLLITTTLIAIGVGILTFLFRNVVLMEQLFGDNAVVAAIVLWLVSGAMISAGLFVPFRHPWMGAAIGLVIQALLLIWPMMEVRY